MSYVEDLLDAYERFVALPWQENLAPAQRVWMAVYPPEHERRLRLHLPEFKSATIQAGHSWDQIDITTSFEHWMAGHEYRDEYFQEPELLVSALPGFARHVTEVVRVQLEAKSSRNSVVGLVGAGTLFGLGEAVKVSALLSGVNSSVAGRLLIFFPGEHSGNSYRLLDARDGWNYLATPITPAGGRS